MAVGLQVGLGSVPKSSLETWRWLSLPGLHSIPGQDEPVPHGWGYEALQFWSEDMDSMILNRTSDSEGSMVSGRELVLVRGGGGGGAAAFGGPFMDREGKQKASEHKNTTRKRR